MNILALTIGIAGSIASLACARFVFGPRHERMSESQSYLALLVCLLINVSGWILALVLL